ncbi:MAG: hypothetical protein ACREMN_02715 [Gemmatimonadales bacterium]
MHRLNATLCILLGSIVALACRDTAAGPEGLAADLTTTASPITQEQTFSMPVSVLATTEVTGCDNSPGPYITISGAMTLGGLGTRMTFTNNVKGTHTFTDDAHVDLSVVPEDTSISIPKQPVLGGVGGNPFIWIQLEDGNGQAVSGEIFLGRCVQGLQGNTQVDFSSLAHAIATIAVQDCANSPGPEITLNGDLDVAAGLDAVFIFKNNDNPVDGPHRANADAVVAVQLVPPGLDVTFNKQPVLGGVGGNPWIWFNFLSGAGAPLSEPALLGRCEQLSKALA